MQHVAGREVGFAVAALGAEQGKWLGWDGYGGPLLSEEKLFK